MSQPGLGNNDPATEAGLVLLHRLDSFAVQRIQIGNAPLPFDLVQAPRVEDCAVYAEGNRPTCVIASTQPAINARLADTADRAFRRATLVVAVNNDSEADLWRRLAWDVIEPDATAEQIADVLCAAIEEADKRRRQWDQVGDFHRRRATLTTAEEDVLEAVVAGKLNKQIANELEVSVRTVEQRRRRMFNKMNVPSAIPLADQVATVRTLEGRRLRRDRSHGPHRPDKGGEDGATGQ